MAGVEQTFEKLKSRGLEPSASTYNILVNAYVDAGLYTEVVLHSARMLV